MPSARQWPTCYPRLSPPRRQEEAGSFKSPDDYKAARGIAWLYNNSSKTKNAAAAYEYKAVHR